MFCPVYLHFLTHPSPVCFQVSLVLVFMVGVIVYKLLVYRPLARNPATRNRAPQIANITGAFVNLTIIMILSRVSNNSYCTFPWSPWVLTSSRPCWMWSHGSHISRDVTVGILAVTPWPPCWLGRHAFEPWKALTRHGSRKLSFSLKIPTFPSNLIVDLKMRVNDGKCVCVCVCGGGGGGGGGI